MADMKQVVAKLVERTAEGRVPWERASQPGMIRATVGDLLVYITASDDADGRRIFLNVMDSKGESIGSVIYLPDRSDDNQELISLYDNVTKFLTDDPRLDHLLEALDAAPRVSRS